MNIRLNLGPRTDSITAIVTPRINNHIRAPELRVIGEDGANLGVMPKEKALAQAAEKGLDLIEINPNAAPPVVRIASYDKYRYEKEKEARKERLAQKSSGIKQIRITARAAHNDLQIRLKKLEEFLEGGHPVEIMMKLRGREKRNKPWAFQKMDEFLKMISTEYKLINPPKVGGFGITAQIIKK